jgi:hypothetical protein
MRLQFVRKHQGAFSRQVNRVSRSGLADSVKEPNNDKSKTLAMQARCNLGRYDWNIPITWRRRSFERNS